MLLSAVDPDYQNSNDLENVWVEFSFGVVVLVCNQNDGKYDVSVLIHTLHSGNGARHQLVEDVVRTLQRLLRDDTRLLQQVGLDISTSQLARRSEVDTDELTLFGAATGQKLVPFTWFNCGA